jgi:hypothetical protein
MIHAAKHIDAANERRRRTMAKTTKKTTKKAASKKAAKTKATKATTKKATKAAAKPTADKKPKRTIMRERELGLSAAPTEVA